MLDLMLVIHLILDKDSLVDRQKSPPFVLSVSYEGGPKL
jgi:hypothetical protein